MLVELGAGKLELLLPPKGWVALMFQISIQFSLTYLPSIQRYDIHTYI